MPNNCLTRKHFFLLFYKRRNNHFLKKSAPSRMYNFFISTHKISLQFYSTWDLSFIRGAESQCQRISFVSVLHSLEFFVSEAAFEICKDGRTRGCCSARRTWKMLWKAMLTSIWAPFMKRPQVSCSLSKRASVGEWLLLDILPWVFKN